MTQRLKQLMNDFRLPVAGKEWSDENVAELAVTFAKETSKKAYNAARFDTIALYDNEEDLDSGTFDDFWEEMLYQ